MKKLLLLDADVVIDLHSFGLFDTIRRSYDVHLTKEVLGEAKHYWKGNKRIPINIRQKVTVVDNVDIEYLRIVHEEAREAKLVVDSGEATSIAYLLQCEEDMALCLCDKAAIRLMSFMQLEKQSTSVQEVLRGAVPRSRLLPRHLESEFRKCIKEGKTLRVLHKKLT